MNYRIEVVSSHSFLPDLLSRKGWVLDVGCKGFRFARRLAERHGCRVIALDPNKTIEDPRIPNVLFQRKALVASKNCDSRYASWGNEDGNGLAFLGDYPPNAEIYEVPTITLFDLQKEFGIEQFDLIKLDAEGVEYEVLRSLRYPAARQISVEFHDFRGFNPYPDPEQFYLKLKQTIGSWYEFIKHERTPMHTEKPIMNYWDSLLIHRLHLEKLLRSRPFSLS
jgi:FkbM family methyltransferase